VDGSCVGFLVGAFDGVDDGLDDGSLEGLGDGASEGVEEGSRVGQNSGIGPLISANLTHPALSPTWRTGVKPHSFVNVMTKTFINMTPSSFLPLRLSWSAFGIFWIVVMSSRLLTIDLYENESPSTKPPPTLSSTRTLLD